MAVMDLEHTVLLRRSARDRCATDDEPCSPEGRPRTGPRSERAYPPYQLVCGPREVQLAVTRRELRCERRGRGVLRRGGELAGDITWQLAFEKTGAEQRQSPGEIAGRLCLTDRGPLLREDRPFIERRRPLHERDAGLAIAGEDRMRDRRGA